MKSRILILSVLISGTSFASVLDNERPVEFQRSIPGWTIVGDYEAGACIAMLATVQPTSLSIAAATNRPELIFSIQNAHWQSIANGEDMRINAIFRINGKAVDGWSLDAVGFNAENTKAGFRFEIDEAKNDAASFPNQFARSSTLEFFNGKIPVGKFGLKKSKEALSLLYECRSQLRANPNFDPFGK